MVTALSGPDLWMNTSVSEMLSHALLVAFNLISKFVLPASNGENVISFISISAQ